MTKGCSSFGINSQLTVLVGMYTSDIIQKDSIKICLLHEALKIMLAKCFYFLMSFIRVEKHLSQELCFINSLLLYQTKKYLFF